MRAFGMAPPGLPASQLRDMLRTYAFIHLLGIVNLDAKAASGVCLVGPQLVVMDCCAPDNLGLHIAQILHQGAPRTRLICIASQSSQAAELTAVGVDAVLLRDRLESEFLGALKRMVNTGHLHPSGLATLRGLPNLTF
jgi:DNA-binding NarL/FixJ family response regulator